MPKSGDPEARAARAAHSTGLSLATRFRRLVPLGVLIIGLLLLDTMLRVVDIHPRLPKGEAKRWITRYHDFGRSQEISRPWLIVIGSSRAREAVTVSGLQAAIEAAKLPHTAVNLAIGGGGSPAMFRAALLDISSIKKRLPTGSAIVYLFSAFELNHLQPDLMRRFPTGRSALIHHGYLNSEHPIHRFATVSGFASFAAEQRWRSIPSNLLQNLQSASTKPIVSVPSAGTCNPAGLKNYRVLEINRSAMTWLAQTFGDQLIIAKIPVSSRQAAVDRSFGVDPKAETLLQSLKRKFRIRLAGRFPSDSGVTDADFRVDCDHITTKSGRRKIARAIVELVK